MGELRTVTELRTMDEDVFVFTKQKRKHLVFVPEKNVRVIWNEKNAKEVEIAEKTFKKYVDEWWLAFNVTPEGGVQIFKFDSSLKEIALVPPMGGG